MLTIHIGRNEMTDKASSIDSSRVDWEATELEYARQLEEAFGDRAIAVDFSDVAPTESISGEYTDSYDIQCILQDVWDHQNFWRFK